MPNEKRYVLTAAVVGCVIFVVAILDAVLPKPPAYGQNASVMSQPKFFAETAPPKAANDEALKSPVMPEPTASPVAINRNEQPFSSTLPLPSETKISPIFLQAAATQNSRLRYGLAWAFGGKSQHGWFLYESLIGKTIGAPPPTDAGAPEFARALLDWQAHFGLAPTATLDDKTLYKLVEYWQSRRLNSSQYPTPDKLLTAPISDFYDSSRDVQLTKVERQTYAAYKRMVAAAVRDKTLGLKTTASGELAPDEKFLKIVSAFRSREYQNQLRRQSPNSGRAGLATNSPHFTGRALDVYVGGEPVTTKDFNRAAQVQTPVYKWLVANAERFGFYPYYYEPWHWEYVGEQGVKSYAPAK